MNEKQAAIVNSFGQALAVVAGAGCGKTTTLVAKCSELLRRHPGARFCAVSFTEKSVRDLKESLTRKLVGVDLSDHWVKTLHGLCASVIQEFPVAAGLQGGERILLEDEADRLWKRSLEVLWSSTDNAEITAALERLLSIYKRDSLERLFLKLRSLMSFGVEEFITKSFHRQEVVDLWRVFESVHHRYQHSKNRDGVLDFNDLETHAAKALGASTPESLAVRRYFQNRFELVLVDEFQDTNPLQWRIIEHFVRPDLSNLCIVGDPKQSIYRFRDADVTVFQDLTSRLPGKHVLDENYRSRPEIIDFVNRVCAPAFSASELEYEPLVAGLKPAQGAASAVGILEWEAESELADYLVSEQNRGLDLSEFVILARSVKHPKTQRFIAALEERGIPVLLGSGGRFYEDPRVQEMAAFLRGWISPKNLISQVTALRSPWIGVSDEWLYEQSKTQTEGFFKPFFQTSDHPVARTLREAYGVSDDSCGRLSLWRPGQIIARLLELPELDEELYTTWVTLWHKCEEWSRSGLRFEALVRNLSEAIESSKIEKEIPAPAARGMVRVMTVHGSKGLQFKRVILVDFDGPARNVGRAGDLIWDRKVGVHLINREATGEQVKDDPENLKWKELEKRASIAESKRLFYVALTRSQEQLILLWKREVKASKKAEEAGFNPFLEDNWRAWVAKVEVPHRLVLDSNAAKIEKPAGEPPRLPDPLREIDFDAKPYRARHSPSEWRVLDQCSLRYRMKFSQSEHLPDEDRQSKKIEDEGEASEPRHFLAEKGERIHRAIEKGDDEALIREFKTPEVGQRAVTLLRSFLRNEPEVEVFAELGFEVPLSAREALVGMMDRLEIERDSQVIRVIDYKYTAQAVPPEKLLEAYSLQLKLYAWAAMRLSGFEPARIEGFLVHFTENDASVIEAPSSGFEKAHLEAEVARMHQQSQNPSPTPRVGEYCRFCEWVSACPEQTLGKG